MDNKEFDKLVEEIRAGNEKVYVYGIEHLAEAALVGMYLKGIYVEAGFDRLYERVFAGHVFGVPILPANKVFELDRNSYIFIAICYDFVKVRKMLLDAGFKNVFDVLGFVESLDFDRFCKKGYSEKYDPFHPHDEDDPYYVKGYHSNRINNISSIFIHDPQSYYKCLMKSYKYMLNSIKGRSCNFMRSLLITPGTKCNNRCVDCCADLQYFDMNREFSVSDIEKCLDRMFETVEYIEQVTISASEPFMHKNILDLVKVLHSYPQIGQIYISTTGQVIVKESIIEELCKMVDLFTVSDYGDKSKNRKEFIQLVRKYSSHMPINGPLREVSVEDNVFVEKNVVWRDIGDMSKRNYSSRRLTEMADKCSGRKMFYLCDNKLYHCFRSASLMRLGILPEISEECIDILNNDLSDEDLSRQLSSFINLYKEELPPLRACDYCNSLDVGDRRVPVAIQVDHKLSPYEKTENPSIQSPEATEYYLKQKFNM